MLGGIVEHVAKDLLHALAVSHDRRHLFVGAFVAHVDALLPEQLAVGVDRVLQFARKINALHAQREAPVLHLGKLQQLFDHRGESAGLFQDDPEAALGLVDVRARIGRKRLGPAADGCERGAQLVGNRRDKLLLDLFRLADLERHIVDIVHEFSQLVAVAVFDQNTVASAGNAARRIAHHRHRLHNVVNKNGIRRRNERHAHERRRRGEQRFHQHPVLCLAQRRYIAQHADHAGIEKQRIGHRKNIFPRLRVAPLKRCHIAGDGALNVLRSGQRACRETVGRDLHAAVRIDKLQFDRVLFLKGLRGIRGKAVVFAVALHAVAREGLRRDARAAFKTRAHRIIVVFLHAHAEKGHRQNKQQQDRQHRRKHPPLAKASDMQRRGKAFSIFRHCSPSFVRCVHTVHL